MSTTTIYGEKRLAPAVSFKLPSIFIIEPFECTMFPKSELEYRLKSAAAKVENALMTNYPREVAMPVILKLQGLIHRLNYHTHKKSIAIFVSSSEEKVFYLDFRVDENLMIDESFDIRDIIYSKKQEIRFLVLLLNKDISKMYLGDYSKFTLIKTNVPGNLQAYERNRYESLDHFSDSDERKEMRLNKFLQQMDQGLSIILNAYDFPVFVMGPERILEKFKRITENQKSIMHYIPGNCNDASETRLRTMMQPYVADWKPIKQQYLLQQLEKAVNNKECICGINAVKSHANKHKNHRLLLVEKDYRYSFRSHLDNAVYKEDYRANLSYVKDAVDDIIQKVLETDGNVELVDNGTLNNYEHIALIHSS
jgi:hypothetical protein